MIKNETSNATNDEKENQKISREQADNQLVKFITKTSRLCKRPVMKLQDGVKLSVQASGFHYCEPRKSGLPRYVAYEVGFPSEVIEQLREYVECPVESDEELLKSVYPLVPHDVLVDIVLEHGGIVIDLPEQLRADLSVLRDKKTSSEEKVKQANLLLNEIMAALMDIGEN